MGPVFKINSVAEETNYQKLSALPMTIPLAKIKSPRIQAIDWY
jgi:hypothetical protein